MAVLKILLLLILKIATWCLLLLRTQSTTSEPAHVVASTRSSNTSSSRCILLERDALLAFRAGLTDPDSYLASWQGEDCCQWKGVRCSSHTGHVVELALRSLKEVKSSIGFREGQMNSSLLGLRQLRSLDLRDNNFSLVPIPGFIGSLENLRYLYLSNSMFSGQLPPQLGNLSKLQYLDLNSIYTTYSTDLAWLSRLTELQYLDLSHVNLSRATDWVHVVNKLPSLVTLNLRYCGLRNAIPSPEKVNLTSLEHLDLFGNEFSSSAGTKNLFWDLPSLLHLDMGHCGLQGSIPEQLGNSTSIMTLHLNENNLVGTIPRSFQSLQNLEQLWLDGNNISGPVSILLKRLSGNSLSQLSLYKNNLTGSLPDQLGHLCNLTTLDLSSNRLSGEIPLGIGALTKLRALLLGSNNLEGPIPEEIGKLAALKNLNLSWNHISGTIPGSTGELHSLESLDLSHNEFAGDIPANLSDLLSLSHLNLSYNNLTGRIPSGNQLQTLIDEASSYIGNPVILFSLKHTSKTYADVAVHLRVPNHPDLTDSFVTGRLEAGDNFETIFLATFTGSDAYKYSGRASCPPATALATSRRALFQPEHGDFSCSTLRAELMFKYKLKYYESNSSFLSELHEPRMIMSQVQCATNGAVRLYAVFSNHTNMEGPWPSEHRFLVEKQAVVTDGFWEPETNRLCLHGCRVVRSASDNLEVRECGIGISFWFPAVWTVRDRSATAAMLWNASHSSVVSDLITASSFQKIVTSNLSNVKYIYNQTMLQMAKRQYLKTRLSSDNKNAEVSSFPSNYTYHDFGFMFSADRGGRSGGAYPVSIGSAMVHGDTLAAESSFSRHAAAEMKLSRFVNVSYGILYEIVPTEWPRGIYNSYQDPVPFEHRKISAEGVYDTKTGFLSLLGCRELNGSTDCQVLITVQFSSFGEPRGLGHGTGRISSLRDKTDVLYFESRNITLWGMYSQQRSESIWRMNLERIIMLAFSSLSCAFAVVQILHTKKNRDAAPATSITMLVVMALGYAIPLALDLDANRGKQFVLLDLQELMMRAPVLIAFVLQLRLLQLAWSGRRASDHKWSGAEWSVLRVCLPLYLIGAAITAAVHARHSRAARKDPLFGEFISEDPGTLLGALASYAGLVTDGFLLPQVLLNASVRALSPWFYVGGTVIRVAPHVSDVFRARRYVPSARPS
ncbi:hypothetical protein PR202_gb05203 [Eleusine coracana subsp. coracana]|uniref:RING-type E3 ubiquitin transferase n=1 Tax=Eleusine coracana subsp. coracana TaxID=191504 RepID=A0AAV5E649_ELECO|nr:hypothetical protein PR202_gb05203 [Eleusine coracana subsp. coracana]